MDNKSKAVELPKHLQDRLDKKKLEKKKSEIKKDENGNSILKLPSGKSAKVIPILGEHIRLATRIADGNVEMFMPSLISIAVTIDDKEIYPEEVDKMNGFDVIALMGYFNNTDENF